MRMAALRCSVSETSKAKVNSPDGEGALLGHRVGRRPEWLEGQAREQRHITGVLCKGCGFYSRCSDNFLRNLNHGGLSSLESSL